MKFTFKVMSWVFSFVFLMTLYVHGQIGIFKVSYDLNAQMDRLEEKGEQHRKLQYEVEQLKAPRLLEEKMKELQLDLALPTEVRVVSVPAPQIFPANVVSNMAPRTFADGIFDIWGRWVKVAQAKMDH